MVMKSYNCCILYILACLPSILTVSDSFRERATKVAPLSQNKFTRSSQVVKKSTLSAINTLSNKYSPICGNLSSASLDSLPFWQPLQNSETCIPKGSSKKRLNLSDKTTAYGENTRVYLLNLAYLDRHRPFIANRADS